MFLQDWKKNSKKTKRKMIGKKKKNRTVKRKMKKSHQKRKRERILFLLEILENTLQLNC